MNEGYRAGTAVRMRAFHVMPGQPPPEGERHAHEYRVEVIVGRKEVDAAGMVVDLAALQEMLEEIAGHVHGRDLERIRPSDAEAVTVEVLARWFHDQLADRLRAAGAATLEVRAWESADAFGAYASRLA
jgi:6-pyruvoyl-tetrahydropterin synthase